MSPKDVPGMVMSNHSMLSKFESERSGQTGRTCSKLGPRPSPWVSLGVQHAEWLSRSLWRSSIREKGSLSRCCFGRGAISLAEGRVPSRKLPSWFSGLADRLLIGSKDMGGAIWTWGVAGHHGADRHCGDAGCHWSHLEIGEGSSFIGGKSV